MRVITTARKGITAGQIAYLAWLIKMTTNENENDH